MLDEYKNVTNFLILVTHLNRFHPNSTMPNLLFLLRFCNISCKIMPILSSCNTILPILQRCFIAVLSLGCSNIFLSSSSSCLSALFRDIVRVSLFSLPFSSSSLYFTNGCFSIDIFHKNFSLRFSMIFLEMIPKIIFCNKALTT